MKRAWSAYSSDEPRDKNRPSKMSSRRAVSTLRVAPGLEAIAPTKKKVRDPRFEMGFTATSAKDDTVWRHKYDFIFEQQRAEAANSRKMLADSKKMEVKKKKQKHSLAPKYQEKLLDPAKATELSLAAERTENRLKADKKRAEQQDIERVARKAEVQAIKEGKKPFFAKKAAVRERTILQKYEELKKNGALDKFLARKRRKDSGSGM